MRRIDPRPLVAHLHDHEPVGVAALLDGPDPRRGLRLDPDARLREPIGHELQTRVGSERTAVLVVPPAGGTAFAVQVRVRVVSVDRAGRTITVEFLEAWMATTPPELGAPAGRRVTATL